MLIQCSRRRSRLVLVGVGWLLAMTGEAAAQTAPIVGGTTPDRRPDKAPVVTEGKRDTVWLDRARRGIEQPYPDSLKFLSSQGNWYTPFDRPGLDGPYDIRRLHRN